MRRIHWFAHVLCAFLFMIPVASFGTVYIVSPDGTGNFLKIQDAISHAVSGDEIIVRPGDYVENLDYQGKNLYVHSSGGASVTTIDGSQGLAGAASCVAFHSGETPSAVLEGFLLQGGQGTNYPAYNVITGGGVYCAHASCTIRSCHFTRNHADNGAGMFLEYAALTLTDSQFDTNTSDTYGGAISAEHLTGSISGCIFDQNQAAADGTISFGLNVNVQVVNCDFDGNKTNSGAGLNLGQSSSQCTVQNCVFHRNVAAEHGGAIRLDGGTLQISGCLLYGNYASVDGGGIIALNGALVFAQNCTLDANQAARNGGNLAIWDYSAMEFANSIFSNGKGNGGVFVDGATGDFNCCDAWANQAGNYVGIPDPTGKNGDIALDPIYCDAPGGNYTIEPDSPCAPHSPSDPQCDLIGAYPVGCSAPVPVATMSWGSVKQRFAR